MSVRSRRRLAGRLDGRAQWFAWRARNAFRTRAALAGVVATVVFIAALLTLALAPRQANRAAEALAPLPSERVDTARFVVRLEEARRQARAEDSTLALERLAAPAQQAPADTFPPDVVFRRDSLRAVAADLGRLITRAENSPLPASYRALASAQGLRANASIAALVDTLTSIERERDEFGIAGGADPIFVALTARATAVGQSIQDVARVKNADVDRRAARARELANVAAPPGAMLAAALSLGLMVGIGTALAAELRTPRLADVAEAESAAGIRVTAVIEPRGPAPERTRRRADVDAPPLIDRTSEAYRLLYLNFAATGSALP